MRNYLLIILWLLCNTSFSQQKEIDSLINLAKLLPEDTVKLNVLIRVCELCDVKDNLKNGEPALKLADKIILTSQGKKKTALLKKKAELYGVYQVYYESMRDTSKIREYLEKPLLIYEEINDADGILTECMKICYYYFDSNNMPKALEYADRLSAYAQQTKNSKYIAFTYFQLADMCDRRGDIKLALSYYLKAEDLIKKNNDPNIERSVLYRNIGAAFGGLHNLPRALEYMNRAIKYSQNKNDEKEIYFNYKVMGDIYKENKDYKNALKCYFRNLQICEQGIIKENKRRIPGTELLNSQQGILTHLNRIGNTYRDMLQYDSAYAYIIKGLKLAVSQNNEEYVYHNNFSLAKIYFNQKNYNEAKRSLNQTYKFIDERDLGRKLNMEQAAYKIDSALNNKDAFNHYQNYIKLRDQLNSEELNKHSEQRKNQEEHDKQKSDQEKQNIIFSEEKKKQRIIIYTVTAGFMLIASFALFIMLSLRKSRQANRTISLQKTEVDTQKHLVEKKQKEIIESITYAKRLQEAILPPKEFIDKHLTNNFILYKPKDLVAGDFYWAEKINDLFFIAAADSTGHGVPGAMVSVVCSNALNRTIKEFNLTTTAGILDKARELVLETFEKSTSEVKDGMDISLLCIDTKNKSIFWSGANNPLWYIQDNQLKEIKADKQPIGKTEYPKPFTTHQIEYKENTTFYLFTDGFADQFGGPKGKKFKYKQFSDLLFKNKDLLQLEQSIIIDKAFTEWKGDLEQVDDVCIIGIKI